MLSVKYAFMQGGCDGRVWIPKHTYVGVPYAIINAGGKVVFRDNEWTGCYPVSVHRLIDDAGVRIIDSARRFRRDMYREYFYQPVGLYCLSFHETKHLAIGDGGMILTDSREAYDTLRQMRFDGRTPGKSVFDDDFTTPGYHCHMKPDVATRGLMLMAGVKDYYEDLPGEYPDLSGYEIFKGGV